MVTAAGEPVDLVSAVHSWLAEDLGERIERSERDRRMDAHLAATVEAKAVHAGGSSGSLAGLLVGRHADAGTQTTELPIFRIVDAKPVNVPRGPLVPPGLAAAIAREVSRAIPTSNAKPVCVAGPLTAPLDDAVPDPLPLRPLPPTAPLRAIRAPHTVPGMRFTWDRPPTQPIPRQEP